MWVNTIYELAGPYNATISVSVKLCWLGPYNELATTITLENNVSCDMPGQTLCMNWPILIMPLSTSMLNCAISLGREGSGSCFATTGLLGVKLCHQLGKFG